MNKDSASKLVVAGPSLPRFICLDDDQMQTTLTAGVPVACVPGLYVTLAVGGGTALLELTGALEGPVRVGHHEVVDVMQLAAGQTIRVGSRTYVVLLPLQTFVADASLRAPAAERRRKLLGQTSAVVALPTRVALSEQRKSPRRGVLYAAFVAVCVTAAGAAVLTRSKHSADETAVTTPAPLVAPMAAAVEPKATGTTTVAPTPTPTLTGTNAVVPTPTPTLTGANTVAPKPTLMGANSAAPGPTPAATGTPTPTAPGSTAAQRTPPNAKKATIHNTVAKATPTAPTLEPAAMAQKAQRLQELSLLSGFDPDTAVKELRKLQAGMPASSPLTHKIQNEINRIQQ